MQYEIRKVHRQYLQEVVSDSYKGDTKKFWPYIKPTRQESSGVSHPINEDELLKSDSQSKAHIQFQSVFARDDTSSLPNKGYHMKKEEDFPFLRQPLKL